LISLVLFHWKELDGEGGTKLKQWWQLKEKGDSQGFPCAEPTFLKPRLAALRASASSNRTSAL